jgi:hypothetical protein
VEFMGVGDEGEGMGQIFGKFGEGR